MKIRKVDTKGTIKCQECGKPADAIIEAGSRITSICMNCYLNTHDRDRIQWYRRLWTMKSMMEKEDKKNKPKKPKNWWQSQRP